MRRTVRLLRVSEWLDLMLAEIERRNREQAEALEESKRRRDDSDNAAANRSEDKTQGK